jgi:hypothetical protein
MKTTFDLTLFDDEDTRNKSVLMNMNVDRVALMFDDVRNPLPDEYYKFVTEIPFGSKVRVTFEVVE